MFEGKRISTVEKVEYGLLNIDECNNDNHEEEEKLAFGIEALVSIPSLLS